MTKSLTQAATLLALAADPLPAQEPNYPWTRLANAHVALTVALPDAHAGLYRGSRFDPSGMVTRMQWGEHSFFGPWCSLDKPTNHDNVMGTAEEFDIQNPQTYDQTAVGESFMKISVGLVRRIDEKPYRFHVNNPIDCPAEWTWEQHPTWIEFRHQLQGPTGYAYLYTKRLTLLDDAPGFVIRRTLRNLGSHSLRTEHYAHNFVVINGHRADENHTLRFSANGSLAPQLAQDDPFRLQERELQITAALREGRAHYYLVHGLEQQPNHTLTVAHVGSNAALRIAGDYPVTKLALYLRSEALCPEPFVLIELDPGQERTWSTTYTAQHAKP